MMSVLVNGAYLPFTSAPNAMQRYVRPALFSTGDALYELQKVGTVFMAKYRNWSFGLMTAHQGSGSNGAPSAEKFVVVVDDGEKRLAVPPSTILKPRIDDPEHLSLEDLIFLDYSTTSRPLNHLDLSPTLWSDSDGLSTDYSFLVGFPTSSMVIELDPNGEPRLDKFTPRWIRQDLEQASPEPLDPDNREMFVKHQRSTRLSIDPDGLSGSPVFSIVSDRGKERHLRFDGIVTHARGDRFAVYPSAFIRRVLDSIVDNMA
ncbi:MAG: hypothetical protein WA975_20530 [Mesorhizobium sp.]